MNATVEALAAQLREASVTVWLRPPGSPLPDHDPLREEEVADAEARMERFRPALATLFPEEGWNGRIASPLIDYPATPGLPPLLVKCDHALPITGSIKARGGVYELLCLIEDIAREKGVLDPHDYTSLLGVEARSWLARARVVVASTGNLGFSIGLVARAFGLGAEVHMSHDAKVWKKNRLRALGVEVVEHAADYSQAVALARASAAASCSYFVDDEHSRRLFTGYAVAARELAQQLSARGITVTPDHPLVLYLPCGVGGAPGGVAAGSKLLWGNAAVAVFVEPTASPCMLLALAVGGAAPVSVYSYGLNNRTVADGLAVASASTLVLGAIGNRIDAAVAVPDRAMLDWCARAWAKAGLRLEPSAASSFAAVAPFLARAPELAHGTHVVWTTGGSLLPDAEFADLAERA